MKEKQQTEIATNISSGAEKVEKIEKTAQETDGVSTKETVKKTVKKPTAKRQETVKEEKIDVKHKTAKEKRAAEARVNAALKKKEEKAKRAEEKAKLRAKKAEERAKRAKMTAAERKAEAAKRAAERKAAAEKRAAERKAQQEKRAAERKARAEKKKAEREAKIRERAHAKANRSQAKSKRKNNKKQKGERREKGYGGWLAAVISLGAVTLALTTAVTLGAIEMNKMNDSAMSGYRATTYELVGIMENVDNDLDRVRLSASPAQQDRILTDLLVQARLAELDLEKMPIGAEQDSQLTSFINRVAKESERMLAKLRNGEKLSEEDYATLQRLYETNHKARGQLDEFIADMQESDMVEFVKKGTGKIASMIEGLENLTLEENRAALEGMKPKMDGAGMERNAQNAEDGAVASKVDAKQAEELCSRYFADYKIQEFQCVGETVTRDYKAYNVQGYDDNGTMLFAEVDINKGELVRFDYFEPCEQATFDMDNVKMLAEQFLEKLGYENMTAVRVRENGTDIDFTYAYETDGVVFYPDSVRVKVCRSRGIVTGFDAAKFIKNHEKREEPTISVTLESAQNALRKGVEVQSSRLAVVETARGERAAYEFLCSYMDENYFIYTDANTGNEIAIINLKNIG